MESLSSQLQSNKTPFEHTKWQVTLAEARTRLKAKHPEEARAVVDPSTGKPPRLTGRQRAKYAKLTPTDDILILPISPSTKLTASEQYVQQPDPPSAEPFYAQFEEIDRIKAQFSLLARCSHAEVDSQARR